MPWFVERIRKRLPYYTCAVGGGGVPAVHVVHVLLTKYMYANISEIMIELTLIIPLCIYT